MNNMKRAPTYILYSRSYVYDTLSPPPLELFIQTPSLLIYPVPENKGRFRGVSAKLQSKIAQQVYASANPASS